MVNLEQGTKTVLELHRNEKILQLLTSMKLALMYVDEGLLFNSDKITLVWSSTTKELDTTQFEKNFNQKKDLN